MWGIAWNTNLNWPKDHLVSLGTQCPTQPRFRYAPEVDEVTETSVITLHWHKIFQCLLLNLQTHQQSHVVPYGRRLHSGLQ